MKTILYVGPFQMPDKNAAAHRVLNNAKVLRTYGYHVVFVGANAEANERFAETKYTHEAFDIFELKCKGAAEKIKAFSDLTWLNQLLDVYDVSAVIAYDYYAYGLSKLRRICRKKRIPLIVDTDEWFDGKGASIAESVIRTIDSEWRMRWLQHRTDGVIAISSFLHGYYSPKLTTITVPPLVDKQDEKWSEKAETANEHRIELVYSGSPGTKGRKDKLNVVVDLLEQINAAYPVRLTVIGVSEQEFLNMAPGWTRRENMKLEVCFKGRIPHKQALELVKQADFSVFLRDDNRVSKAGFPTKFVESISAGVPVITNNTGDIASFLNHGINGYLVSDDLQNSFDWIFAQDIATLKRIKQDMQTDTFDFRNYIDAFKPIIDIIEQTSKK